MPGFFSGGSFSDPIEQDDPEPALKKRKKRGDAGPPAGEPVLGAAAGDPAADDIEVLESPNVANKSKKSKKNRDEKADSATASSTEVVRKDKKKRGLLV